jgi:parvulin-like peptidyl-prolyl isomerase
LTIDPEVDIHISRAGSGQLLKPFKTEGGIYIIKIFEKIKKEEDKSSAMDDNRLKWQIYNKFYRQLGDSLYKEYTREFSENYGTEISDKGIDEFIAAIEVWAQNSVKEDTTFTETQRGIVLARIGDQEITAGHFIDEFQGTFINNYVRFNDHNRLKKVLKDYVDRFLVWIKKAEADGIDKLPEVQEALTEFRDNQLTDVFDRTQILPLSKTTPEEIDAYYERNKDKYRIPKKIKIWEIMVQDEKLAEEILQEARSSNASFEDLAKKYSVSSTGKERGGALGYLDINSNRPFIDEAFEAGENQIIGPIGDNKNYYIIKTGDMLPEQVRTKEQIEPTLRMQAQNAKADSIREEIFDELKSKYEYQINKNTLKSIN